MNDIAICGKDARFCRLLELELRSWGYSAIRNPHNGAFRLWIVDLDTITQIRPDRLYLGFTRESDKIPGEIRQICQSILPRPFSMSDLRREVSLLLASDLPLDRTVHITPMLQRTPSGFELDGEAMLLTEAETLVLDLLYEHRGETVTREALCAVLGNESNIKLADVYVCLLRKKLEKNGCPRLLFTVRGIGYRLEKE